ncbi:MAG: toluene tolerance protein [Gammaproteobacteria bacterium]|nr:toluene tolerance protein [Gammaproteobacteria bacterium]
MSGNEYAQLTQGAVELERDNIGVKVLLTPNGHIVKLIRIKRWFSLSVIYPYSLRFRRNAIRLTAMGIPSVVVERVFYCHQIRRHGVIYPMVKGESLEKIADRDQISDELFQQLAAFVALLHRKGIYFRSLHLGNILLLPDGELGLIDVADMRFSMSSLRIDQRRRNFRHLFRTSAHRKIFARFGVKRFLGLYIDAANLSTRQAERVMAPMQNL